MIYFLIGLLIGIVLGVLIGAFVIKRFNVTDYSIDGKYKAKNGGKIDLKNILKRKK